MDPNRTLAKVRVLTHALLNGDGRDADAGVALAEAIDALDEWLQRGGYLPAPWEKSRRLPVLDPL